MREKIYLKLRKATTPIHIICGFLTVFSGFFLSPLLGIGLWFSFLAIEVWNKKEWEVSQDDFWEFVFGIFLSAGIILIWKLIGGIL